MFIARKHLSRRTFLQGIGATVSLPLLDSMVAAEHIGQETPLPSLELSIEESVLNCEASFSCAYRNSIAWKSATEPLPMYNNPRLVFEKLFGVGATDAERRARRSETRSLLDSVMSQVAGLQKDLPAGRRRRPTPNPGGGSGNERRLPPG